MIALEDNITPLQIYFVYARSYDNTNVDIEITNVIFTWKEDGLRLISVLFDRSFTGNIKFNILYI